jgi:hypothetical protein
MNIKTCNKCCVEKPTTEFHRASRNRDGYYHTCKVCKKEIDKQYNPVRRVTTRARANQIREWLRSYKQERGCRVCGEREPVALDFHHQDEQKEFNLSDIGKGMKNVQREVEKCVVLCANCHRKFHASLLSIPST